MAEISRSILQKENTYLCKELRDLKLNDFLEQKRRQQLRSNNHELRQLNAQLQSALVFKKLREQKNYLKQLQKEDLLAKREEKLKLATECEIANRVQLEEDQEIRLKKEVFRDALTKQVDELRQRRRLEIEDVVKDREEMAMLIKRIQKEEMEERKKNKFLQERYKIEMEESYRNIELQKQLEKKRNIDENERYLAYQKKCDELKSKVAMEKKILQREKEAFNERIGHQLSLIQNEKQKRKDLLHSLFQEEHKAKEDEHYRQNLQKQIKQRKQIHTEQLAFHNKIRMLKEKQFKEEEDKLRVEHLLFLAERDKLNQLSDEKRRRKVLEHNKDLKEMIELRRIERAKQIAERINEYETLMAGETKRKKLIEEERIRILSSAPKELLKYLPPGVLTLSDKEVLTLLT